MEYLTSALIGLGVGIIGTGLGSLLVGLIRTPGEKLPGFLMGLSGGVMLSLVFFDMLPEAVEAAGFGTMLLGTALGGLILWGMHRLLPQVHDHGTEQLGQARSNRELLHTGCFLCLGIARSYFDPRRFLYSENSGCSFWICRRKRFTLSAWYDKIK